MSRKNSPYNHANSHLRKRLHSQQVGYSKAIVKLIPINGEAAGFNVPVVALGGGGVGKSVKPGDGLSSGFCKRR
ncbi:MAG: hypothetical protein R3C62_02275 [Chloroflexota bacterium]